MDQLNEREMDQEPVVDEEDIEFVGLRAGEDEEDVDVDVDEDEEEQEGGNEDENDDDAVIDGGVVAANVDGMRNEGDQADRSDPPSRSTDCALVLLFQCAEDISQDLVPPNHSIFSKDVTVSIGLEKSTKLSDVFERYCTFANRYHADDDMITDVKPKDLEFSFCSILQPQDTAESSALMKNDRIKVRNVRTNERATKLERIKLQNEFDRNYFNEMKTLMREANSMKCNILLHCQGKIKDENGLRQEVLNPYVKGHGGILAKRCKWLAEKIQLAKDEKTKPNDPYEQMNDIVGAQRSACFVPINDEDGNGHIYHGHNQDSRDYIRAVEDINDNADIQGSRLISNEGRPAPFASRQDLDEDDDSDAWIQPVERNESMPRNNNMMGRGRLYNQIRAPPREVEFDEDENAHIPAIGVVSTTANTIPFDDGTESNSTFALSLNDKNYLVVDLSHPPEAVKLLLEYCYTNRVMSLGYHAFVKSFKPSDSIQLDPMIAPHVAPVGPYNSTIKHRANWPNFGLPTISLHVALAGIQLAEEAGLQRLSYMCECAATILVTECTSLEALALCESQYRKTGNCLPTLRKTVMLYHLMNDGSKGVLELYAMPSFQRTLKDRSDVVVPSMMLGVMEVMKEGKWMHPIKENPKKRDELRKRLFDRFDHDDSLSRKRERNRSRKERWNKRTKRSNNPYRLEDTNDEFTFDERNSHEEEDIIMDREGKVVPLYVGKVKGNPLSLHHRERKGHSNSQGLGRKGSRSNRRKR